MNSDKQYARVFRKDEMPTFSKTFSLMRNLTLFAILSLFVFSCQVKFVSDYDAGIHQQIVQTADRVERMYTRMLMDEAARPYSVQLENYVEVETQLRSLLRQNQARDKGEGAVKICQNALEMWTKYRLEHEEKGVLGEMTMELYRENLSAMFQAMEVEENAKKIAQAKEEP
jgi:hypothetical protein